MSTDPREFEHPIDGTGGNVTPEAIEAAADALAKAEGRGSLSRLSKADQKYYRELMTAALTAAAPLMEAQAKAEALREAADALNTEAVGFQIGWSSNPTDVGKLDGIAQTRGWLCVRAATIESGA